MSCHLDHKVNDWSVLYINNVSEVALIQDHRDPVLMQLIIITNNFWQLITRKTMIVKTMIREWVTYNKALLQRLNMILDVRNKRTVQWLKV